MTSAHARYRARLSALADGSVDEAVRAHAHGGEWRRTRERFDPDEEPFATCVYQTDASPQQVVRIGVFTARPDGEPRPVRAGEAGWLRLTPLPSDPKLPALPLLLGGPGRRTVVRYSPFRRCTIRVEHDGRTQFAKVYADGRGERAHEHGVELWRADERGELEFAVARAERFDPATGAVWQGALAGERIAGRFASGNGGEALARRLGCAAASLSRARIRTRAVVDAGAALACAASRCAELERRVPELGGDARRLLEALARAHASAGASELRPVHGALHPSQWLDDGSRLGLLDYDSVALGDPELDAGTFLADLDAEDPERVSIDAVNAAFLDGYESVAPLDAARLRSYRAHGRLARAVKASRALLPDGDAKAARRLRLALECSGGSA